MMIIMQPGATREEIDTVIETVHENSMTAYANVNQEGAIIGVVGENRSLPMDVLEALPCVKDVLAVSQAVRTGFAPLPPAGFGLSVCGFSIGGKEIPIIAGPCSVESREQIIAAAQAVKGGRGERSARRRVQTTPVRLTPSRGWVRIRVGIPGGSARPHRLACGSGGHVRNAIAPYVEIRGCKRRSARATCRTSACCAAWVRRASPCYSSAG